jgi:hypothetical protein
MKTGGSTVDCLDPSFARSGVPHSRGELVAITSDEVTAWECRFFNYGQAVADYFAVTFAGSVWTLALRRAAQSGQQQVCVTPVGQVIPEPNRTGVREDLHDD